MNPEKRRSENGRSLLERNDFQKNEQVQLHQEMDTCTTRTWMAENLHGQLDELLLSSTLFSVYKQTAWNAFSGAQ